MAYDSPRTIAAKRRHAVGRRRPMPPPNDDAPLPCPDALPKQHCTPKIIGMMCVWPGMPNKSVFGGYYLWLEKRIHIARQYGSRCNMDSFLLNKKGLEEVSILPKNFCNMHITRCNMHIAIESKLDWFSIFFLAETVFWTSSSSLCLSQRAELG